MSSRKPLRPPKRLTLAFVHRETGAVHKRKTWEFRNELQAILKMAAWVTGMMQEGFTPEKYRLVAFLDPETEEPSLVVKILRNSGIEVYNGSLTPSPPKKRVPELAWVFPEWESGIKTPSK